MSGKPLVRKYHQTKLCFEKFTDAVINSSDEEESEINDEASDEELVNFLCEFCDSSVSNNCRFQSRDKLLTHCLKHHPTACLGCFEMFASSADLLHHSHAFPHEPPVCRVCVRIFSSATAQSIHKCSIASKSPKSSVPRNKETEDSLTNRSSAVKMEPQDEESNERINTADDLCKPDAKMKCIIEEREAGEVTSKKDQPRLFLCEICGPNDSKTQKFGTKDKLIIHYLKCHPNACVGCFATFASSADLLQHIEAFPHEPPVCRGCFCIFKCAKTRSNHRCRSASRLSQNKGSKPRTSAPIRKAKVKEEPKDFENESEEEDSLWNEGEDDPDEEFSSDEVEGAISDEAYVPDKESPSSVVKKWRDVAMHCMHCSYVAKGWESMPSLRLLRNHTFLKHAKVCLACFEGFGCVEALTEHRKSMNHNISSCVSCKLTFHSKETYRDHFGKHHPDQCPFRCSQCSFATFKEHALRGHMRRLHKQADVENGSEGKDNTNQWPRSTCPVCDFRAETEFAVMMHLYDKHPEPGQVPKFKCEECQMAFSRSFSYGVHIRKKHWGDPHFRAVFNELKEEFKTTYECEHCQRYFMCRASFIQHIHLVHRSSIPYVCSVCSLGFLDPIDLRVHDHVEHINSSPYSCDSCGRSFVDLDHLVSHLNRVHKLKTMPYAYCFKHNVAINDRLVYIQHMSHVHYRKFSKNREVSCKQCGKVLSSAHHLQAHMKMHQPERPFVCQVCGKGFTAAPNLSGHEKMHSKDFQCTTCKKTFHSAPLLKRHAVVHTGEKPFECDICGLKVSQKSALKRHMDKVHPGGIMGKTRSTKPRKCRVLSKALEKQEEEEEDKPAAVQNAKKTKELPAAAPSSGSKSVNSEPLKSEALKEQTTNHVDELDVRLDSNLLSADLRTKPRLILPGRKRRRTSPVSADERRDPASLRPRKRRRNSPVSTDERRDPASLRPRKLRRRQASKRSRRAGAEEVALWNASSDSEEEDSSSVDHSDDKDASYEPPQRRSK